MILKFLMYQLKCCLLYTSTCVAFMGGDSSPEYVNWLAGIIRSMYTSELDKGCPIARHEYGLARSNSPYHLIRAQLAVNGHRQGTRAIGVARPDDRRRKRLVTPGVHEYLLAGDLVSRVLPVRIAKRRGFADEDVYKRQI